MARITKLYDERRLHKVLGRAATAKQIKANQLAFVRTVLSNLFVIPCMDAIEFNLTVRSLNQFFRCNKSIGLVVIDGLHFIENYDVRN